MAVVLKQYLRIKQIMASDPPHGLTTLRKAIRLKTLRSEKVEGMRIIEEEAYYDWLTNRASKDGEDKNG